MRMIVIRNNGCKVASDGGGASARALAGMLAAARPPIEAESRFRIPLALLRRIK